MSEISRRAPAADFLRVISIGIVGWYHIWQQSWLSPNFALLGHWFDLYPLISRGYMFVYLMLLISGFVLTLGYLDGRYKTAGAFYKSRAVRILPCYLLCLVVFFFYRRATGDTYSTKAAALKDILGHLTFTQNLFAESYTATKFNAALWTVAVETQFYLLFPLIMKLFSKKPLMTCLVMALICLLCKLGVTAFIKDHTLYVNRLPLMLDIFALGMAAALGYFKLRDKRRHFVSKLLSVFGVAGSVWAVLWLIRRLSYVDGYEAQRIAQIWYALPFSLCGGVFLLCGSLSFDWLGKLFSNKLLLFLSGISYNFYIWHQPLAVKLKQLRIPYYEGVNPNMQSGMEAWKRKYVLICFFAALAVSMLITYAVEKPCAKLFSGNNGRRLKPPREQ